jgi:hypothetical protein
VEEKKVTQEVEARKMQVSCKGQNKGEKEQRDEIRWIDPKEAANSEAAPVILGTSEMTQVNAKAADHEKHRYACITVGERQHEQESLGRMEIFEQTIPFEQPHPKSRSHRMKSKNYENCDAAQRI